MQGEPSHPSQDRSQSFFFLSYFSISSSSSFKCIFTKFNFEINFSFKEENFRYQIGNMFSHSYNFFTVLFCSLNFSFFCDCIIILFKIGRCIHVSTSLEAYCCMFITTFIGLTCIFLMIYLASFLFSCISTISRGKVTTLLARSSIIP